MIVIRNSEDADRIAQPSLHALVALRLQQLGQISDGLLLVVEAADSVKELEAVTGIAILHDPFSDVPLDHPDYSPPFDYIEAHYAYGCTYCFEAHADTGDDGLGITLFVPAEEGIDKRLLVVLKRYAVPATGLMEP